MTVTLTQTKIRPDDTNYEIEWIGINYKRGKVTVHIRFGSGDEQDIVYEGADLVGLRNRVVNFNGLKATMEADIAANQPGLAGVAS